MICRCIVVVVVVVASLLLFFVWSVTITCHFSNQHHLRKQSTLWYTLVRDNE
jgi:hypothetical protein